MPVEAHRVAADNVTYRCATGRQTALIECLADGGDMLVKAALGDEHGNQQGFEDGTEQMPAAHSLDRKTGCRRGTDHHYHGDDPAIATRGFAAVVAIELAIEKRDRATRDDDRMVYVAENRRHVAEERIDDKACDQHQQRIDANRHHHAVNPRRQSGRDGD